MATQTPSRAAIERRLRARARAFEASGKLRDEAIRQASKAGLTYQEIGRLVGVSKQRVHQIVTESRV